MDLRQRIEHAVARQPALALIGAQLEHVGPGEATFVLPFRPDLAQHMGFFHGGIVATLLDVACGMAALTTMADTDEVVSAEFKLNFLAPARGTLLRATGRVMRAGRVLTVCTGEASVAGVDGEARTVGLMQATMCAVGARLS